MLLSWFDLYPKSRLEMSAEAPVSIFVSSILYGTQYPILIRLLCVCVCAVISEMRVNGVFYLYANINLWKMNL